MRSESLTENQEIQYEWCRKTTEGHRTGAIDAVKSVIETLKSRRVSIGPVIEIGPRHGHGMQELSKHSDSVIGIEIVPIFQRECVDLGMDCRLGAAEDILNMDLPGKYNFYLRDVAEHFTDREEAIKGIREKLLDWVFISVPIEPIPTANLSHVTRFTSIEEAQSLFEGLTLLEEFAREPTSHLKGRYEAIWVSKGFIE